VNFRTRVILASAVTAALAVLLACGASFLSTRNALFHSVDQSLTSASQSSSHPFGQDATVTGASFELVFPNGEQFPRDAQLPVNAIIIKVAKGDTGQKFATVTFQGSEYRELIVPLSAGSIVQCNTDASQLCELPSSAAQVFSVNVSGQQMELHHLAWTLGAIAVFGVLLALALGLIIARAAVRPLVDVTNQIESIAETSDMKSRLEEGKSDELGRLRRVFNQLLASVDQSQTLQRQLVLDASHELRTPLTSLRTNAQVLSRANEITSDDLEQITTDMVVQVDELASLVTDLGELARGERSEGALLVLRLDEITEDCVATARTHARTRSVSVEYESDACSVLARRDRLSRAISNLINNAIKFAPEGGQVRVRCFGGAVSVEDNGPGVPESERANVFDRFWRSPSARALPGSGLGLAIVQQVADEFEGTIAVSSSPDLGGAAFTLRIPTI